MKKTIFGVMVTVLVGMVLIGCETGTNPVANGTETINNPVTGGNGTEKNPLAEGTEADITVTGLSTKTGKYLRVGVYKLGETVGKPKTLTPLLISTLSEDTLIGGNSITIRVIRNGWGKIDPNSKYDVSLSFYKTISSTSTTDFKHITDIQFTSGSTTISY